MTDYDAALRAARGRVRYLMVMQGRLWGDGDVQAALDTYEALARAVGAVRAACPVGIRRGTIVTEDPPCALHVEADRLAVPYLETEESLMSKREAR